MLRNLLARAAAAPAGDRESRLCLAMLGELVRDTNCPEELRGLLANSLLTGGTQAGSSMGGSVAGVHEKGGGDSSERLRRHMQDVASEPATAAGRLAALAD